MHPSQTAGRTDHNNAGTIRFQSRSSSGTAAGKAGIRADLVRIIMDDPANGNIVQSARIFVFWLRHGSLIAPRPETERAGPEVVKVDCSVAIIATRMKM